LANIAGMLFFQLACALVVGAGLYIIAGKKGRDARAWGGIGGAVTFLVFGPVGGLILVVVLACLAALTPCNPCGGMISPKAKTCKYCGRQIAGE
jgi:hypothetical protein